MKTIRAATEVIIDKRCAVALAKGSIRAGLAALILVRTLSQTSGVQTVLAGDADRAGPAQSSRWLTASSSFRDIQTETSDCDE
jgi:hypothetical protein